MGILNGKVAVVTGGTRGLGLSIAQAFAGEGAAIVVASRSQQAVDAAVQQFSSKGQRAAGLAVDVGNLEQVEALARTAIQQFGRLDVWVNNAGVAGPYGPTMGFAPETFYQVAQTNIIGVYNGSRTAMHHFLSQRTGKLINMLGHGYQGPVPWQNAYSASKAWVRSFTMSLAEETKESGVGVYAFNPGMVLTDLLTNVEVFSGSEDRLKQFPRVVRMWAKPPEQPARKAVWIASSATNGKTGLLISVFSPWLMMSGALKEGWRALLKRPTPIDTVRIRSVPPAV
ncbi:MAG TPA: SDR family oxidoreductase [Anaerolineae bacterium]|jgi:NAD(P)-dependent dehydrogenase (short-subunit alcohol dehydrogenase family)